MTLREPAFVVGLDRAEVLRRRTVVRRVQRVGAWVTVVLAAIGAGLALTLVLAFPGSGVWPFGLLMIASVAPLVVGAVKALRSSAERERWYAATDLPPFAMRMTHNAVELGCEGAAVPLVLPWAAFSGLTYRRRLGQPVLEASLAPGVTADTVGVSGLDQPAVRAAFRPNGMVKPVGLFGVAALDQPVDVIDHALRRFSGGRVGVAR